MVKKIFYLLLFALFCLNSVMAVPEIEISVSPVFNLGDDIEFSYTITSQQNENISFIPSVECDGPMALLDLKEITLEEGETYTSSYNFGKLTSVYNSGMCNASITIIEPYFLTMKKSFEVETPKSIDLNLKVCKDRKCSQESKVFSEGETIYFDYESDVKSEVNAELVYPDSTVEVVRIPGFVTAPQDGVYKLRIVASASGYESSAKEVDFGVIEIEAVISSFSKEDFEEVHRESQETLEGEVPALNFSKKILLFTIIGLLALALIITVILLSKNKKLSSKKSEKNK